MRRSSAIFGLGMLSSSDSDIRGLHTQKASRNAPGDSSRATTVLEDRAIVNCRTVGWSWIVMGWCCAEEMATSGGTNTKAWIRKRHFRLQLPKPWRLNLPTAQRKHQKCVKAGKRYSSEVYRFPALRHRLISVKNSIPISRV